MKSIIASLLLIGKIFLLPGNKKKNVFCVCLTTSVGRSFNALRVITSSCPVAFPVGIYLGHAHTLIMRKER